MIYLKREKACNMLNKCRNPKLGFAKILDQTRKQLTVHCMGDGYQTKNGPRQSVALPAIKGTPPNQATLVFDIKRILAEDPTKPSTKPTVIDGNWKYQLITPKQT